MNWLLSCLFGHGDRLRERDATGRTLLVCDRCGHSQPVKLDAEFKKGPAHQQAEVRGSVTTKAIPSQWFERRKVS